MNPGCGIVLIGMPGAGKSTAGVLLAKATSRTFIDSDVVLQAAEGRRLRDIIAARGTAAFRAIEERHVLSIDVRGAVVATGGSVVYSDRAMGHLAASGVIVYLRLPYELLQRRLSNLHDRGVLIEPGQTLHDLYDSRTPLYERYAQVTIDCAEKDHEQVVEAVLAALPE